MSFHADLKWICKQSLQFKEVIDYDFNRKAKIFSLLVASTSHYEWLMNKSSVFLTHNTKMSNRNYDEC